MTEGLPPIDQALVPANVRAAGPDATKRYDAALSFEGMLDEQLAQALTQTLQGPDDGSDDDGTSTDAATSLTLQLLPQSLAQGLVAAGGTGLAAQLYQSLTPPEDDR
jgi:Rod binding domain-containing protein